MFKKPTQLFGVLLLCLVLLFAATACQISLKTKSTTTSSSQTTSEATQMTTITVKTTTTEPAETTTEQSPATTIAGEKSITNDDFKQGKLPDFWHLVSYVTLEDATRKATIQDGILSIPVTETDRAPILVSDPIPLEAGQILIITRKVRLHYGNEYFNGAMRITGLADGKLNLTPGTTRWDANFGKILANIDYLHYFYMEDKKAATDGFVLYNVVDGGFSAAAIAPPVFDKWYTETLTYNARTGAISWNIGGKTYKAKGLPLKEPAVSVMMHSYGWYTGHQMDLDQIEINTLFEY